MKKKFDGFARITYTFNIIRFKNRTLKQDIAESNTSHNLLIFYFYTRKDFLTLYFW
jgi:hypothetical protein